MKAKQIAYHNSVLLEESVRALITDVHGTYVDVTFGGGGHSRAVLQQLAPDARLLAFDQDSDSLENRIDDPRFQFVPSNFRYLKKFLQYYRAYPADGILADLGVSSHQFDEGSRGFSYRFDAPLDMRMNTSVTKTAREIVNTYSEQALTQLFSQYGELPQSRKIANKIVVTRLKKTINTTLDLVNVLSPLVPSHKLNKFLSPVFQSLRIEVNAELEALKELLQQLPNCVKSNGRVVFIAYHSLEDRLVKNFLKAGNFEGEIQKDFYGNILSPFKPIAPKMLKANEEEITANPRARSAVMRVAERTSYE
jgi:16S rRNA (cytosine1402-N4)-methyltransferase